MPSRRFLAFVIASVLGIAGYAASQGGALTEAQREAIREIVRTELRHAVRNAPRTTPWAAPRIARFGIPRPVSREDRTARRTRLALDAAERAVELDGSLTKAQRLAALQALARVRQAIRDASDTTRRERPQKPAIRTVRRDQVVRPLAIRRVYTWPTPPAPRSSRIL